MKQILHSKPWLTISDAEALIAVLNSGMIAQGEKTREFEGALSSWFGNEYGGVATGSGSAALVLALTALGVGANDEVILPTYVCPSVLEAILTTEATPVLCDVGCNWVVTKEDITGHLTSRTKAVIVPHLYGIFADVESFFQLDIPIIEDCAQALDYPGKRKLYGDVGVFSFHPTKCLTTGEGGMAISSNPDLVAKMQRLRDGTGQANTGRLFSPMADISAALGLHQLSRYHTALDRRRKLAYEYKSALDKIIPDSVKDIPFENSMFFRFPLKILGGIDVYQALFAHQNICIRRGVDKLLHRLMGLPDGNFKISVDLFNTTVSLPIYPALADSEHAFCVKTATEIFSRHL